MQDQKLKKIGIIGMGYVGKSVRDFFDGNFEILTWDILDAYSFPDEKFAQVEAVFVCIPTPQKTDGSADVEAVEETVMRLKTPLIIIKSTVPPGTTEMLAKRTNASLVFWPEYVGESSYHNPYFPTKIAEEPFAILGGQADARRQAVDLLLPVLGPTKTIFQCSSLEAELAKYAENTFFATKVTFVNEMAKICEAFDADWNIVREAWLLDPRIERMHTAVFTSNPGFAGKCLPKDLSALIAASRSVGYEPQLLETVQAVNLTLRQKSGLST